MSPVRIMVDVPESLAGECAERLSRRATLLLVVDEVRSGRLTRPAGARLLGMPLDDFLIEAGKHGLYAIDYDYDDFSRELGEIAFDRMDPDEQITHVQDLWDRIAARPENVEVNEAWRAELERRSAELDADPTLAIPWEDVRARIRARLRTGD